MRQVTIAGNIGRNAETRRTQDGTAVTSFTVAAGRKDDTIWFDCSIWGARGEKLAPYLTKGGKITVSGQLSKREHDGRTFLQIRVDEVALQGGGQQQERAPQNSTSGGIDDDEIPF